MDTTMVSLALGLGGGVGLTSTFMLANRWEVLKKHKIISGKQREDDLHIQQELIDRNLALKGTSGLTGESSKIGRSSNMVSSSLLDSNILEAVTTRTEFLKDSVVQETTALTPEQIEYIEKTKLGNNMGNYDTIGGSAVKNDSSEISEHYMPINEESQYSVGHLDRSDVLYREIEDQVMGAEEKIVEPSIEDMYSIPPMIKVSTKPPIRFRPEYMLKQAGITIPKLESVKLEDIDKEFKLKKTVMEEYGLPTVENVKLEELKIKDEQLVKQIVGVEQGLKEEIEKPIEISIDNLGEQPTKLKVGKLDDKEILKQVEEKRNKEYLDNKLKDTRYVTKNTTTRGTNSYKLKEDLLKNKSSKMQIIRPGLEDIEQEVELVEEVKKSNSIEKELNTFQSSDSDVYTIEQTTEELLVHKPVFKPIVDRSKLEAEIINRSYLTDAQAIAYEFSKTGDLPDTNFKVGNSTQMLVSEPEQGLGVTSVLADTMDLVFDNSQPSYIPVMDNEVQSSNITVNILTVNKGGAFADEH